MRNFRLLLEYDGTHYHGWQRQPKLPTIQQTLEETIAHIVGEVVHVTGSGRTDAQVHALGQVGNFRSRTGIPTPTLLRALNGLLPQDIAVKAVEEVPLQFDACLDAVSKTYRYTFLNRPMRSPTRRLYCLHVPRPLWVERMEEASHFLLGRHDFSSFCSSSCSPRDPARTLKRVEFVREHDLLRFYIESDGFLHHMVRSIVGTLLDVGLGKIDASDFRHILQAKDRRRAGKTAPPYGLCLMEVQYPFQGDP